MEGKLQKEVRKVELSLFPTLLWFGIGCNLPSLKCINFLKNTRKHNKVILLVGSDRVEAFKRYNEEKMNELFGVGNAFILQSGGERGDSGEGDKALDELEVLFANMSLDDDNSGESKVPVREDYSGSLSRKSIRTKRRY